MNEVSTTFFVILNITTLSHLLGEDPILELSILQEFLVSANMLRGLDEAVNVSEAIACLESFF